MNSRDKGARGERECAKWLEAHGFKSRRGQQFSGGEDSPDVVSDLPFHIEVKRVESLRFDSAVEQSKRDANGKPWVVLHRKNGGKWFAILDGDAFLGLVRGKMGSTGLVARCDNCIWGLEVEDRYDHRYCSNDASPEAFGNMEASGKCHCFMAADESATREVLSPQER